MPVTFWLYIFRKFTITSIMMITLISLVIMLFDSVELFRVLPHHISALDVFSMAALKNYARLEKALPFLIMLSSMITYGNLNKHTELTVSRSLGFSIWHMLLPSIVSAFTIGLMILFFINPIGAFCYSRYEKMRATTISSAGSQISFSKNGIWLQQTDSKSEDKIILHIGHILPYTNQISKILAFTVDKHGVFKSRIDSDTGVYHEKTIILYNPIITLPKLKQSTSEAFEIETEIPISKIAENLINPTSVSFLHLLPLINSMKESGYPILAHQMQFYKMLSIPLFLMSMVMVGICFSIRIERFGKGASMHFIGATIGFFIYLISDIFYALGASGAVNMWIATSTPIMISVISSSYYLLEMEEG